MWLRSSGAYLSCGTPTGSGAGMPPQPPPRSTRSRGLRGTERVVRRRLRIVVARRTRPSTTPTHSRACRTGRRRSAASGPRVASWSRTRVVLSEPGVLAQARRVIAEAVPRRAPCPAGVLPLRLRRQPIPVPARLLPRRRTDSTASTPPARSACCRTRSHRSRRRLHRIPSRVLARHAGPCRHSLRREAARVPAHHRLVLLLRDLVHAQVERPRDPYPVLRLLVVPASLSESGEPIRNSPAGISASFIPIELVIVFSSSRGGIGRGSGPVSGSWGD